MAFVSLWWNLHFFLLRPPLAQLIQLFGALLGLEVPDLALVVHTHLHMLDRPRQVALLLQRPPWESRL